MKSPFFRIASKGFRALNNPFELHRLGMSNSEIQKSLAGTIRKAGKVELSNAESEWINKIENKRARLLAL